MPLERRAIGIVFTSYSQFAKERGKKRVQSNCDLHGGTHFVIARFSPLQDDPTHT